MKIQHIAAAQALRRRGVSLQELSERFSISKSTASLWTKGVELSPLGIERITEKAMRDREKGSQTLHRAKVKRLQNAEVNADQLIGMFLQTLKSTFQIDEKKLRANIHLHDYHNEAEMIKFWSSITHIPTNQFQRSFKKKSNHKYTKEDYKGCAHIYYYDAHVARVLLSFAKKLGKLYI